MSFKLLLSLFLIFTTSLVFSKSLEQDLTAGTVFPSMNSSVIQNPAALPELGGRRVEFGAFLAGSNVSGGNGSLVGKVSSVGLGIDFRRTGTSQDSLSLAAGFPLLSSLSFGLGFEHNWSSGASLGNHFYGGIRFGISKIFGSLVFDDLQNLPGNYILGLGGEINNQSVWNFDFLVASMYGSLEPASVLARPTLVYSASKQINLKFGFEFPTYPSFDFDLDPIIVGISYWPNDKIGFFFTYNEGPDRYTLGLKLL